MHRGRFLAWAWVALLAGCGTSQAAGDDQPAERVEIEATPAAAARPRRIESLSKVSLDGLDAAARQVWIEVVNDVTSPCGEPVSVARCVSEERACQRCVPAARYLARLAREGYEPAGIRELYRARYDSAAQVPIAVGDSPVRGAPMAPITVVEFSDFECPHCAHAHPILEQLVREHDGDVRVVYKNYPLEGHVHAREAARAAIAAQHQGKFWEMHDRLFDNQEHLEQADIERYATELGLDMARFHADLEDEVTEARVAADRALGTQLGVQGTPTLFVNGRPYLEPIESLSTYVQEEVDQ
jgi:protein-disulfide isomerase